MRSADGLVIRSARLRVFTFVWKKYKHNKAHNAQESEQTKPR